MIIFGELFFLIISVPFVKIFGLWVYSFCQTQNISTIIYIFFPQVFLLSFWYFNYIDFQSDLHCLFFQPFYFLFLTVNSFFLYLMVPPFYFAVKLDVKLIQ